MLITSVIREADCGSQMKSYGGRHLEKRWRSLNPDNLSSVPPHDSSCFLPLICSHFALYALIAGMCQTKILHRQPGLVHLFIKRKMMKSARSYGLYPQCSSREPRSRVSEWKHGRNESKENKDFSLSRLDRSDLTISVKSTWGCLF